MKRIYIILFGLIALAVFGVGTYYLLPDIFGSVVVPEFKEYQPFVAKYADQYGVRRCLVMAVIRGESGGNPRAVSRAGAMGLMQLMPGTANGAGKRSGSGLTSRDMFDPESNIHLGTWLLAYNIQSYGSDELALAAYNGGGAVVKRPRNAWPRETINYVPRIKQYQALYEELYRDFCSKGVTPAIQARAPQRQVPVETFEKFTVPADDKPNISVENFWDALF